MSLRPGGGSVLSLGVSCRAIYLGEQSSTAEREIRRAHVSSTVAGGGRRQHESVPLSMDSGVCVNVLQSLRVEKRSRRGDTDRRQKSEEVPPHKKRKYRMGRQNKNCCPLCPPSLCARRRGNLVKKRYRFDYLRFSTHTSKDGPPPRPDDPTSQAHCRVSVGRP